MYTYTFLPQFALEFGIFPEDQQQKVLDFLEIYENYGLSDFGKYEGKISPSWVGLEESDPDYIYCHANALWHYHIGFPEYIENHPKYKTSEWVLHFQISSNSHINIVDMYSHYDRHGIFYIPSGLFLKSS